MIRSRSHHSALSGGLLALVSALLVGCFNFEPQADPARFYVLSAPQAVRVSDGDLDLVLRGVAIPDYLDNSKIALRVADHEIRYHPFHRWAGTLDQMVSRAFVDALAEALPEKRIAVDYGDAPQRLDLTVLRFEPLANGIVEVALSWRLEDTSTGALTRGRLFQTGTWDGEDFGALVDELSALLQAAATEWAAHLSPQD